MVLCWLPGQDYPQILEFENIQPNSVDCVHLSPQHADWPNLRVLQLLSLTDHTYSPEYKHPSVGSAPAEGTVADRLSPIPEEPSGSSASGTATEAESL